MQVLPRVKVEKGAGQPEGMPDEKSAGKLTVVPRPVATISEGKLADNTFRLLLYASAVSMLVIVALILFELVRQSNLSRHNFRLKFFSTSTWNPVSGELGALPFIFGKVVSSLLALLMAVPLSLG